MNRGLFSVEPPNSTASPAPLLLFVCVENCCRSQMAEAFARRCGQGQVIAYSAGIRPVGRVHPTAIEAMREVGYDLAGHRSKGLGEMSGMDFDTVITMGCGDVSRSVRARRFLDWDIPVPKHMPLPEFRTVRNQIERQVKELLAEVTAPSKLPLHV